MRIDHMLHNLKKDRVLIRIEKDGKVKIKPRIGYKIKFDHIDRFFIVHTMEDNSEWWTVSDQILGLSVPYLYGQEADTPEQAIEFAMERLNTVTEEQFLTIAQRSIERYKITVT